MIAEGNETCDNTLTAAEKKAIADRLTGKPPKTKHTYAQSDDPSGTQFFEISDRNGSKNDAEIKGPWTP